MSKGKKVTIGYRYFFGIHMGLGRGPLDALLAVKVGGKSAWQGHAPGNQTIYINQPKLFGGDKGEGGIVGPLDIMMGAPDQPVNSRLAAMLGGIVPAFRGMATLFYDGLVTTLNPYPKPWEFRVRRILQGWDGEVWYPAKAPIPIIPQQPVAIYIALDLSGSMNELTGNGLSRLANAKTAINGCLDMIKESIIDAGAAADIMIVGWGSPPDTRQSITRRSITSASGINDLKSWVAGRSTAYGTYFPAGLIDMSAFFAGSPTNYTRLAFFITDGEPASPGYTADEIAGAAAAIVWANPGIPVHGINIDLSDTTYTRMIDTTDWDDVPVVDGGDPSALTNVIMAALGGAMAMNPAHILYECYTNPDWGRGLDPSRLDLDAFTAAADTLHAEGLGLCLKWTRQDSLANFIGTVLDHIGGSVFTSRRTGRIVLRLIRDDYDPEELQLFTPDTGLLAIDENDTGAQDRAINEVVVKWLEPQSNEVRQVRAQNLAGIHAHGVISETTEYPGLPSAGLAVRVAQRDLTAYSSGVKKLKVRIDRRGRVVEPGGVFRISDPARGIDNLVLRAGRVDDREITSGEITITAVQDVFGLPSTSYAEPSPPIWSPPSSFPVPLTRQRIIELPYRDLVRITSPADLQMIDDTTGYLLPLASKPSPLALGYDTVTRVGTSGDFEERDGGEFVPSAAIVGALDYLDTEAVLTDGVDLQEVVVGGAALIDEEIVRVDALDPVTGAITIGRGCVDTVPARHLAGARIWFIDEAADGADPTEYIASSEVQTKLLTRTSSGVLAQASALTLTMEMAGRHALPYPPAGLLLNGEEYPSELVGNVTVAFRHRDRTLQADQLVDTTEADIGPEPGTTYEIEVYDDDTDTLVYSASGITSSPAIISAGDVVFRNRLLVWAARDGLRSFQPARHVFEHGDEPWTPAHLTVPPQIWLDDESPISQVSGACTEWGDRSSNGRNFVQPTAANRPQVMQAALNGRRALRFDGINDLLYTPPSGIFSGTGAAWALTVYRKRSAAVDSSSRVLLYAPSGPGATRFNMQVSGPTANAPALHVKRLDSDPTAALDSAVAQSGAWVSRLDSMSWATGIGSIRLDGEEVAENTALTSIGNTSGTVTAVYSCSIGATNLGSAPGDVDVAAVIVGTGSVPTAGEIDKLFGWAAHRYGLVDNLPIDHPYKDAPPIVE